MITAPRVAFLVPLALLLVACESQSAPVGVKLQAMSFANSEWSEPVHLDAPVNSPCQEQTPTLSKDELALYFMSNRQGGLGNDTPDGCQDSFDLWVATRASRDDPWDTPVNLGSPVNTSGNEAGPALSPDGRLLFFYRWVGTGQRDIYVSRRDPNDLGWETPVSLGPAVAVPGLNSTVEDNHASVRRDGREIFFNSRRPGAVGGAGFDIWVATRENVHDPWSTPVNLGEPVNSRFAEFHPNLSFDGRTLLFISGAARGGLGGFDIWMTTRTVSGR